MQMAVFLLKVHSSHLPHPSCNFVIAVTANSKALLYSKAELYC